MTRLEFCVAVKKLVETSDGKWPYPGALADVSGWFTTKTPEECAAWMKAKVEKGVKRARRN